MTLFENKNEIQNLKTEINILLSDTLSSIETDLYFFSDSTNANSLVNLAKNISATPSIKMFFQCTDPLNKPTCIEKGFNENINDDSMKNDLLKKKETFDKSLNNIKNQVAIIKKQIIAKNKQIQENKNMFANTLNKDYTEIYKYRYLRNWGIFLSIIIATYTIKQLK